MSRERGIPLIEIIFAIWLLLCVSQQNLNINRLQMEDFDSVLSSLEIVMSSLVILDRLPGFLNSESIPDLSDTDDMDVVDSKRSPIHNPLCRQIHRELDSTNLTER